MTSDLQGVLNPIERAHGLKMEVIAYDPFVSWSLPLPDGSYVVVL